MQQINWTPTRTYRSDRFTIEESDEKCQFKVFEMCEIIRNTGYYYCYLKRQVEETPLRKYESNQSKASNRYVSPISNLEGI